MKIVRKINIVSIFYAFEGKKNFVIGSGQNFTDS